MGTDGGTVLFGGRALTEVSPAPMRSATYILPIRRETVDVDPELTRYLAWVAGGCELIVVGGSSDAAFACAHDAWSGFAVHISPEPGFVSSKWEGPRRARGCCACESRPPRDRR